MPNKTEEYLALACKMADSFSRQWEHWAEFLITAARLYKYSYELVTGRRQKSDVIAYQIRQSFKPGEITAEEANKVGYELAMRFTKGKYAFLVATHTDREHIHNHIIYNSTALDCSRKFRDFLLSGLAVQRLSDLICLEHSLSVIEIKPYRERQKRVLYPPKESNRDQLCGVIDSILADKPGSYEEFLKKLEQQGYEVKRGKFTSVKGVRQKRFIRFRTLGAGYSEEELKAVLAGEAEHCPRKKHPVQEQKFQMLVDIQVKLAEGKGDGYARWAKRYNLKEMSKTLIFLQENKIGSMDEMEEQVRAATMRYHELGDSIKAYVGDLERGVKTQSLDAFIRIVEALDVPADVLIRDSAAPASYVADDELNRKLSRLTPGQKKAETDILNAYIDNIPYIKEK